MNDSFTKLYDEAATRGVEIVLPLYGEGRRTLLRIEARKGNKIIEHEQVRNSENVYPAAVRMHNRMKRDIFR